MVTMKITRSIQILRKTIQQTPQLRNSIENGYLPLSKINDFFDGNAQQNTAEALNGIAKLTAILKKRITYLNKLENRTCINIHNRAKNNLKTAEKVIRSVCKETLKLRDGKRKAQFTKRAKTKKSILEKLLNKASKERLTKKEDFDKLIRDIAASRIVLPKGNAQEIEVFVKEFVQGIKEGKIKPVMISNYHGENTKPYLSADQEYEIVRACLENGNEILQKFGKGAIKKIGYTCLQINYKIPGNIICELQIRGREVDRIANAEHIFYKYSNNPNYQNEFPQITKALEPIGKIISGLDKVQRGNYRSYLRRWYNWAREFEITGIKNPEPKCPKSIPKELSIENLNEEYRKIDELKKQLVKELKNMVV